MRSVLTILLFMSVTLLLPGQALSPGQIGSDQHICYGDAPERLTFSTLPSGGLPAYSYQWQRSNNGNDWYDITGIAATTRDYTPTVLARTAYFRCRVTDASASSEVTNTVTVSVTHDLIAPVIGNAQTVYNGTAPAALLQIQEATGGTGDYSYKWQVSDDGISFTDITGANDSWYTPEAMVGDRWFRQWVIDYGCGSTATNSIRVSTRDITIYTTETPQFFTNFIGLSDLGTEFEPLTDGLITHVRIFAGGGDSGSHEVRIWRQDDHSGFSLYYGPDEWSFTSGQDGIWQELALYSPVAVEAHRRYIVSITNGIAGNPEQPWAYISNLIIQNPNDYIQYIRSLIGEPGRVPLEAWEGEGLFRDVVFIPFFAGRAGEDQTICFNVIPEILGESMPASGGSGGYAYQWQSSADGQDWNNIEGATSTEFQPPALTTTTYYRRAVRSGEFTVYSPNTIVHVNVPFTEAQLSGSINMYENSSANFKIDITGGTNPFNIEYTINGAPQPPLTDYNSGTEISTGQLVSGVYVYSLTSVTDSLGCQPQTLGSNITITVSGTHPGTSNRNALVMVNTDSPFYGEYNLYVKPYLEWFGIPCDIYDTGGDNQLPDLNEYAVIIMGHPGVYNDDYPLSELSYAVFNGTGLYSFDQHLFEFESDFCQPIYEQSGLTSTRVNIDPDHYITQYHQNDSYDSENEIIFTFLDDVPISIPGYSYDLVNNVAIATLGDDNNNEPLLQVANHGAGRIVKWNSNDWLYDLCLGPLRGMDDLVWRGIVWAARKPFIMQGLPPMVTMRVDDVDAGSTNMTDLQWVDICNEYGIIPWLGIFLYPDPSSNLPDLDKFIPLLRNLANSGLASISPHSFTYDNFIYTNYMTGAESFSASDSVRKVINYFNTHNLPMSKYLVPHFYLLTADALTEIRNMGVEFIGTKIPPDPEEYFGQWLQEGPYRNQRVGNAGSGVPHFYADSVNWEGNPFFLCLSEIADRGIYEWYPGTLTVNEATAKGIRTLRKSFISMTLGVLFTHEDQITMPPNEWREIISGIVSGVSTFDPEYLTTEAAAEYIRAKHNIKLRDVLVESGVVSISVTGVNDRTTQCFLFNESDGQITQRLVLLPRVSDTINPVIVSVND